MLPTIRLPAVDTGRFVFGAAGKAIPDIRAIMPALHEKQQEIKDDPARFKVADCGRRFGKNILEHDLVVDGLIKGWPVGFGSPSYKNMTEDWRALQYLLAPITRRTSEQERRIECVTGGVLELWSLENPGPIRGRKYKRFIVNEAATVPYLVVTWNEIIRATLIDLYGDAFIGGTPKGMNGFYTLYDWGLGNKKDWKSWKYSSYANPHIDPAELDAMRETLTEEQFQQEIMAEFIQSAGAVFRNLTAALTAPATMPEEHKGHTIVGGIDWAQSNDFTALSLGCVDCQREVFLDRFNQIEYEFQAGRVEAVTHQWQVKRWRVERNSIGGPMFEALIRRGVPAVPFETTLVSKRPLIEGLALALEKLDVLLLTDEAGRAELQAYESKETAAGNRTYSAPDGMHDDTVIARALMWQQMRETPKPDPLRKRRQAEIAGARRNMGW